jgi:hypothetical protein
VSHGTSVSSQVALHDRADDVGLDAAVDGEHLELVALAVGARRLDRHFGRQVALVRVDKGRRLRRLRGEEGGLELDASLQRALLANLLGEQARVDPVQRGHLILRQPLGERSRRIPVRVVVRVVVDDEARHLHAVRLEEERQAILVDVVLRNAIVSDDRAGQH